MATAAGIGGVGLDGEHLNLVGRSLFLASGSGGEQGVALGDYFLGPEMHSSCPVCRFQLPTDDGNKKRTEPRTNCPEQVPMPTRIRQTEANEEAKLSEFQQELMQLASLLNGDHLLSSLQERIRDKMNMREGIAYVRSSVKRFFEAGMSAKRMGVDDEQIVKMRPSLTTRIERRP